MQYPWRSHCPPALVAGDKSHKHSMSDSDAVEKVKGTLTNINGFEVEDVRTGDGGVACVTYHVTNDANGLSQARAVVDGDQGAARGQRQRALREGLERQVRR